MSKYNWQLKGWPEFSFEEAQIEDQLFSFAERIGHVNGMLKAMPEEIQLESLIEIMVTEAIKTSEIEGEFLSRADVMSSIKNNLGFKFREESKDKRIKGVSSLMLNVRHGFNEPLNKKNLFSWHELLLGHTKEIAVGKWRSHYEPMQIVSGAIGKEKVHFEAPPSKAVPEEMRKFFEWFNSTTPGAANEIKKAPIRSAIAHVYFESIHPFEDGNGRIGRAIAEKALSQGIGRPVLLSLSKAIESNKKRYYFELGNAQKTLEISRWVEYFVNVILEAQIDSEKEIDFTLKKAKFFDRYKEQLNDRQINAIKRIFEEGPKGFKEGMNAKKYVSICKVSKATATRDLQYLLEINALMVSGGGRSTSYQVNL